MILSSFATSGSEEEKEPDKTWTIQQELGIKLPPMS
jgi:hypothetical protein